MAKARTKKPVDKAVDKPPTARELREGELRRALAGHERRMRRPRSSQIDGAYRAMKATAQQLGELTGTPAPHRAPRARLTRRTLEGRK